MAKPIMDVAVPAPPMIPGREISFIIGRVLNLIVVYNAGPGRIEVNIGREG